MMPPLGFHFLQVDGYDEVMMPAWSEQVKQAGSG